jgi:hypothetical protein
VRFCCVVGVSAIDRWRYDVLDMVEGIAGETVIKLTQEEKGINSLSAMDGHDRPLKN